jgi:hypothetical protein
MTLDQLIIQSEVLESIKSERRKTHFLQYVQKRFNKIIITGNKDFDFISNYFVENQNPNFKIEEYNELIDVLELNEIEPEQGYVLTFTEEFQIQAKELEMNYSHRPTNLEDLIKELK